MHRHHRGWHRLCLALVAWAAALVLILLVFVLNVAARAVTSRASAANG